MSYDGRRIDVNEMFGSIIFIRHAAALQDRHKPRDSWPLSTAGRAAAACLAATLKDRSIERVLSSPARRALDTAAPLVASRECGLRTDARLIERDFGPGWIDDFDAFVARAFADRTTCENGAESFDACAERMLSVVREIDPAVPTAVVGHGQAIAACLSGAGIAFSFDDWRNLAMPDVLVVEAGGWRSLRA